MDIPYWVPTNKMPEGFNTEQPKVSHGLTHVHHFYTKRNVWVLSKIYSLSFGGQAYSNYSYLKDWFQSISTSLVSKLNRFRINKAGSGMLSGTLYVASTIAEQNVIKVFTTKLNDIIKSKNKISKTNSITYTQSSTFTSVYKESYSYIFVDPPFGGNIMYSELNFLWEAWLRVFTNNQPEAVINAVQHKGLYEYQALMQGCFDEFFRVLKPGRWMTVEFHNSQNAVWNAIQEALQRAGFVIADVRILDKQQQTFKQVTTTAAVKQDLIISAYKPNGNLEERFRLHAGRVEGVWEFVRYHLGKLPVVNIADGKPVVNAERLPFLLYDRMVAFHIQRGVMVPISAPDFYAGLSQHFIQRDGMVFFARAGSAV
jgi:hypothetical protein